MEDQRRPLKKLHLKLVKKPSVYSSTKEDRSSHLKKLRLELVHQPFVYDSSMEDQSSLLKKFCLELAVSSTTPEIALKALSSPCFSPMNYKSDDDEPIVIFNACMKFMMNRLPEGSVQGIWVEFLRKTITYSLNFSKEVQDNFGYACLFPNELETWLCKALSTNSKCPYITLQLFHLMRLYKAYKYTESWDNLFIHTICEIQPHHLYPSGNEDDVIFTIEDMLYMIMNMFEFDVKHQVIVSRNTLEKLIFSSDKSSFLSTFYI